jgi:hypothetical protein
MAGNMFISSLFDGFRNHGFFSHNKLKKRFGGLRSKERGLNRLFQIGYLLNRFKALVNIHPFNSPSVNVVFSKNTLAVIGPHLK